MVLEYLKLPAHRRGFAGTQWRAESEQRKFHSDCAPSCLLVGRDPAYPALAGRGTCQSGLPSQFAKDLKI
jgi:hypothetical protein